MGNSLNAFFAAAEMYVGRVRLNFRKPSDVRRFSDSWFPKSRARHYTMYYAMAAVLNEWVLSYER